MASRPTVFSFGSAVYLISAVFDPKFRLKWIDNELDLDVKSKEDLRKEVTGCLAVNWSFGFIGCILKGTLLFLLAPFTADANYS